MKFREYLQEVKEEDLSYFESFIREEFPKGSKIRYGNNKKDSIYITWRKINPSRIPKHGRLAGTRQGSVVMDGEVIVDKKDANYNFKDLLTKMNKLIKYNEIEYIKNVGISFDEGDTTDGNMYNAVFRIGDYK